MNTENFLLNSIAALLGIYAVFGFSDAILLHIWKFQLYKFHETEKEHRIHTVRALLFPFLVLGILIFRLQGVFLYCFLTIITIDLFMQIWDMWIEREARKKFAGLSSLEYTIHGILISIHSSFLALYFFYQVQMNHFQVTFQSIDLLDHSFSSLVAWNLLPGAVLIGILHCILMIPYFKKNHNWEKIFQFRITIPGLHNAR